MAAAALGGGIPSGVRRSESPTMATAARTSIAPPYALGWAEVFLPLRALHGKCNKRKVD